MNARCCDVTTRVYPRHDHDRDSGLPDKGSKSSGTRRASWTKRTLRRNACRCGRCYWSRGKRLHVPAIERRDCTGHWIRRRCVKTREALHRAAKNSGMQSCRDNAHAESQQAHQSRGLHGLAIRNSYVVLRSVRLSRKGVVEPREGMRCSKLMGGEASVTNFFILKINCFKFTRGFLADIVPCIRTLQAFMTSMRIYA
jgi:hypothetical protein